MKAAEQRAKEREIIADYQQMQYVPYPAKTTTMSYYDVNYSGLEKRRKWQQRRDRLQ